MIRGAMDNDRNLRTVISVLIKRLDHTRRNLC